MLSASTSTVRDGQRLSNMHKHTAIDINMATCAQNTVPWCDKLDWPTRVPSAPAHIGSIRLPLVAVTLVVVAVARWLVVDGCWLVVGGRWLVIGG